MARHYSETLARVWGFSTLKPGQEQVWVVLYVSF